MFFWNCTKKPVRIMYAPYDPDAGIPEELKVMVILPPDRANAPQVWQMQAETRAGVPIPLGKTAPQSVVALPVTQVTDMPDLHPSRTVIVDSAVTDALVREDSER